MELEKKYLFSPTDEFIHLHLSDYHLIIDAFERRILGWFLNPIESLLGDNKNLFIVTAVECMLVDALSGFRYGVKRTRGKHFVDFLVRHMNFKKHVADEFRDRFRNGIVHQTSIKEKSCITDQVKDLHFEGDTLFFNPQGFYKRLRQYFESYLGELRSNEKGKALVHENFKKRFEYLFYEEFDPKEWAYW